MNSHQASVSVIIDRLKDSLQLKTDKELCQLIGIKQNTLSTWKKRESIDFSKIISICYDHKINLDDIFFIDSPKTHEQIVDKNTVVEKRKPSYVIPQKQVKLVNTNRNICMFIASSQFNPEDSKELILIGQKVKSRNLKSNITYVIEFNDGSYLVDELENFSDNSTKFQLVNHANFKESLLRKNIRTVWQILGSEPSENILQIKEDIIQNYKQRTA